MKTHLETDYADMVRNLKKDPHEIELNATTTDVVHMVMGVCGEAGELLDAIKKHAIYGKPLDRENVIEELGDIEFYLEGLRQRLFLERNDILTANMTKLYARYSDGSYSDESALAREDKPQ